MDLRHQQGNSFNVGMNKDLDPELIKDGLYVNAINARLNTNEGNLSWLTNEPANFKCTNLPLPVIGYVPLIEGRIALFMTDDFSSEIGILDGCTYTKVVNDHCLNFNRKHLIYAVSKQNFDCSESIYWTDDLNPRRVLNLSNVPYKFTEADDACRTKTFTKDLNCDELLVDKKISYPKISTTFGPDGQLGNGSYQVSIAYTINDQVATDWMGTTFPIKHFSHEGHKVSLEVKLENLDQEFDGFALAVIYTVNGSTAVDKVGNYSIGESKVVVLNVGLKAVNNIPIPIDEIIIKRPIYGTAVGVNTSSTALLWSGPTTKKELDYQLDAMNITAKWVAYKVPKDYYRLTGYNVGYMRDEVYAFGIQWLYQTGDWSPAYHIPGRPPKGRENKTVSGTDVYERGDNLPKFFQVYNTAKLTQRFSGPKIAEGTMAYWESEEIYEDNKNLFGDQACTPIRHHKFPDSGVIHIHDNELGTDSGAIILGIKFENIKRPDDSTIVGYRIVRGDRQGNRSIIAKGLLFNTGTYKDNDVDWMYPNYPYNDLRPDPFLSTTQTTFLTHEQNYNKFGTFNTNKFTFHSPSTAFNKPELGGELKLEVEEQAEVKGKFEEVYRHPKYKFITNFSFGIASAIAVGGAIIAIKGRKCVTTGLVPGGAAGIPTPFSQSTVCETELVGRIAIPGTSIPLINVAGAVVAFGYYFALGLETVINVIKLLANWQQFAYQYNSHGLYSAYKYVEAGNKRREITYGQYLIPGNQDINGVRMNNFNREGSVYLELGESIKNPSIKDISRNTISGFGLCDAPTKPVVTQATSYYAAIKRKNLGQYGQLTAVKYLDTGTINDVDGDILISGDIFGGDTYISRVTEKRKFTYFLQWPFDVPDGYEWDYRRYANIPYPRFWIDGTEYDFGNMAKAVVPALGGVLGLVLGRNTLAKNLPSSKHNLDCYRALRGVFIVKDRYFYLFNSGVIDYYAESEYNSAFRDYSDSIESKHYDWRTYTNLSEMFRSDKIQFDNKWEFDKVYLKQLDENFIPKQSPIFDPKLWETCFTKFDNRIIYSLPTNKEQVRDNWLIYPGLNYFDFSKDDGTLNKVVAIDRSRLLFTFRDGGPQMTLGVDTLQTDGTRKILLGDGGMFAQEPQDLIVTDYFYGASESAAGVSTHFGVFYPSQNQGRVFEFGGTRLDDITRDGLYYWFKQNFPSKLLADFPEFIHKDNIVVGVGVGMAFDAQNELLYITKKDYKVKSEFLSKVKYDPVKDEWRYKTIKIEFPDPLIFEDASFTISYDPKANQGRGGWVSFHDWHPDFVIQGVNHFLTYKDGALWVHNSRCDLFSNFYGVDYPFEVETVINSDGTSTLANIIYEMEAFQYTGSCVDKYHLLDFNFDELIVYNTEQISGVVKLERRPETMLSPFPIFDSTKVRSEYTKVEQKYKIQQFWDLTKDRMNGKHLLTTQANGYRKVPNAAAIKYNKEYKKKFRHNYNNIILRRSVSGPVSMRMKVARENLTLSPR